MMRPETEAELAEMIAGAQGGLALVGGGTRDVHVQGDPMCLAGLGGIELYEPGALTLVVGAGTPIAEIDALLAAENQRLPFEPMDHRGLLGTSGTPTIGGVVAANVSGPRRIQAGACRDFLLGVRFVDGRGTVIKNGGRVMKNVTGYDLVKLMAGSWGTLGALSQVSFKVLPKPETELTLLIGGLDVGQAVQAMSAALGSPFEVTGAAYGGADRAVMLRIEGAAASVDYRAGRLTDMLGRFGAVTTAENSAALWQDIRDVKPFHGPSGDVWKLSVKPSDGPAVSARLNADDLMFDWGGGLIWARVPQDTDLRARVGAFDGHATLVRASADTKARLGVFHPQSPTLAAISAGIQARFDPRGIFNHGLMQNTAKGAL